MTTMSDINSSEQQIILNCAKRIAKKRQIAALCLYGSKAAGYSRPGSDYDIIIVLESYRHIVKYVYTKESQAKISALVVDRNSLEKDADNAFLGEFVIGRLLHTYKPILNEEFFFNIEIAYRKRVIIEEVLDTIKFAGAMATEITFPLEFILFSKIKKRSTLYPNAKYSYFKTYNGPGAIQNTEFSFKRYNEALERLQKELGDILVKKDQNKFSISEKMFDYARLNIDYFRQVKKLHDLSSYLIHTYAGRKSFHYAVKEAESKISRHISGSVKLPDYISAPKSIFWEIPEGKLLLGRDWLKKLAATLGFKDYFIRNKKHIGSVRSRTYVCVLSDTVHSGNNKEIVIKQITKSNSVALAALNVWTLPLKRFKLDPLTRLSTHYKAARTVRDIGLKAPVALAVVLDRRILISEYIHGMSISEIIKNRKKDNDYLGGWIKIFGEKLAILHIHGYSFGSIKPDSVIIRDNDLYFTCLEQFEFRDGDPLWDITQFLCLCLKNTRNMDLAEEVTRDFLTGYTAKYDRAKNNLRNISESADYIERFYPILYIKVARLIKELIKNYSTS